MIRAASKCCKKLHGFGPWCIVFVDALAHYTHIKAFLVVALSFRMASTVNHGEKQKQLRPHVFEHRLGEPLHGSGWLCDCVLELKAAQSRAVAPKRNRLGCGCEFIQLSHLLASRGEGER